MIHFLKLKLNTPCCCHAKVLCHLLAPVEKPSIRTFQQCPSRFEINKEPPRISTSQGVCRLPWLLPFLHLRISSGGQYHARGHQYCLHLTENSPLKCHHKVVPLVLFEAANAEERKIDASESVFVYFQLKCTSQEYWHNFLLDVLILLVPFSPQTFTQYPLSPFEMGD